MCVSDGFEDTVYQKWKAGRAQVCRVLQHVCLSFPFFKASTLYRLGLKEGSSRGLVVVIQVVHPLCYCLEYPPEQKQCTSHHVGSGQGELSSIISWIIIGSSIRCIACYYLHPKSPPFCMGICFLPIRLFVYLRVVSSLAPSRPRMGHRMPSLSQGQLWVTQFVFGI